MTETKISLLGVLLILFSFTALGSHPDSVALKTLLQDFLKGASEGDIETHKNFWDDNLIYTSASGERFGKSDILEKMHTEAEKGSKTEAKKGSKEAAKPVLAYSASDIKVQLYENTAIVAFRLIARTTEANQSAQDQYFNTGTFVKKAGQWRAVAWQATKIKVSSR